MRIGALGFDRLLTTRDVADMLSVSPRTVCVWAECCELAAIKIGKQWRFRVEDVKKWLSERSRAPSSGESRPLSRLGLQAAAHHWR